MSTNISVSNKSNYYCEKIISKFQKIGIDCRIQKSLSIIDQNIEKGCIITLGPPYNRKDKVKYLWDNIKEDYSCAHLSIDGVYNGCIKNYLYADFCV